MSWVSSVIEKFSTTKDGILYMVGGETEAQTLMHSRESEYRNIRPMIESRYLHHRSSTNPPQETKVGTSQ